MPKKRHRHSAEFKAEVALEALKNLKTLNELAVAYTVHPTKISQWKQQFQEGAKSIFPSQGHQVEKQHQDLEAQLFEEIGRLQVALDWLKKKTEPFH
jgi:putative transposase